MRTWEGFLTRLVLVGLSVGYSAAQNRTTAEIIGTLTDSSGAVLAGATVTVVNVQTKATFPVTTNQAGYYDVPFLPPGIYAITYSHPGFQTINRGRVELQLGQNARLDVTMQVGATQSSITVDAATPLVEQEESQRGTNISNELVGNLPLVGRDPSALAVLAAGTSTAQSGVGANPDPGRRNINGNRAFSISATINGGSAILPQSQNFQPFIPALSAVSEFSVVQDNFSAEYENGTSVLNMVTKSGTNRFSGSLFEFLENDLLNARNLFAAANPPLRYNQFGGTLGGPVVRNKLFFFFSYQNTLNPNSTINIHTTPTAAVRAGDFTGVATIKDATTGAAFARKSDSIKPHRSRGQGDSGLFPPTYFSGHRQQFLQCDSAGSQEPLLRRESGLRPLGSQSGHALLPRAV